MVGSGECGFLLCIFCAAPVNSTDLKMVQVATLAEENDNFTYNCERQGCASLCETNDTVWPGEVAYQIYCTVGK